MIQMLEILQRHYKDPLKNCTIIFYSHTFYTLTNITKLILHILLQQ